MYATLMQKIQTTLESVPNVKLVFSAPKTKIDQFPAVFYVPGGMSNQYATNAENEKVYRFTVIVIVGIEHTTADAVFNTVLPNTVDAVIAQFDTDWNAGTIDGHRVRVLVASAEEWGVEESQDGLTAYAPLAVEIRLLSSI